MKEYTFCFLLIGFLLISCHKIQYKTQTQKSLPELGSLGVFEKYIAQEITIEKSVIGVNSPLKLKVEIVTESKREIFTNKDSINSLKEYLTLEVLDKFSLLEQINQNKELFGYLKSNPRVRIVTKVFINFSETVKQEILDSQELYLIQNKQKTLSIELRDDNKTTKIIEFSEGKIIDFEPSEFCWGTKKGFKVQILDVVNVGSDCNGDLYKTYKKAKRKTEFNY
tara:strand:- start:354 stop:1025 length:672 start_codon:yes stop_codon:yes gene_type:complete